MAVHCGSIPAHFQRQIDVSILSWSKSKTTDDNTHTHTNTHLSPPIPADPFRSRSQPHFYFYFFFIFVIVGLKEKKEEKMGNQSCASCKLRRSFRRFKVRRNRWKWHQGPRCTANVNRRSIGDRWHHCQLNYQVFCGFEKSYLFISIISIDFFFPSFLNCDLLDCLSAWLSVGLDFVTRNIFFYVERIEIV